MATSIQIGIEEYLQQSYRPDREYVDGEVLERNVGTWEHSRVRMLLGGWFLAHEAEWGILIAPEWRARVSATRVRIPDLTVVVAGPQPAVLVEAPLLVVEILSPGDSYSETERRARDYREMGVRTVWIIDPETRTGRMCVGANWTAAERLEVAGTAMFVNLPVLFGLLEASGAK